MSEEKSYHIKVHRGIMAIYITDNPKTQSYHIKVHRGIMVTYKELKL